jgi:hypothetical protein
VYLSHNNNKKVVLRVCVCSDRPRVAPKIAMFSYLLSLLLRSFIPLLTVVARTSVIVRAPHTHALYETRRGSNSPEERPTMKRAQVGEHARFLCFNRVYDETGQNP